MGNSPPIFWFLQILVLLVWGLTWFLVPGTTLAILTSRSADTLQSGAVDQLRMSAPYLLGLSGFTLFAVMTRRTAMRTGIATVFAIVFGLWGVLNAKGIIDGYYGIVAIPLAVIPFALSLGNLFIAATGSPTAVAEDNGDSSTKPSFAFTLWLIQGVTLLSGAAAFLIAPQMVLGLISAADAASFLPLAVHQTRLLGAISTSVGMLSILALFSHASFAWRGFAYFFCAFLGTWTASIGWILMWGDYDWPVLQVLLPGLAFLPANYFVFRMQGEFDPGDVQRHSDAWTPLELWAGPIMALSVLLTKRRSSHLMGVAASGRFIPSENLRSELGPGETSHSGVPANAFFTREQRPVLVRFANLTQLDDAALDVRGCAIKFSNHPVESPLDLLMNTGSFCPAHSIVSFSSFVLSKFLPQGIVERATRSNDRAREGGVAGLRRAPQSFGNLDYYGQLVRYWTDLEGRRHLVRYRCVRDKKKAPEESGIPDEQDASRVWLRARRHSETRPSDYLREEMRSRLSGKNDTLKMKLQAQFHHPFSGESEEWYNPSVDWDEAQCPWLDLGDIVLETPLPDHETEFLQFNPGNHPDCLDIPSSTGPFGYRSLGESEVRVVSSLARTRTWMYGRYGLPEFGRVFEQ